MAVDFKEIHEHGNYLNMIPAEEGSDEEVAEQSPIQKLHLLQCFYLAFHFWFRVEMFTIFLYMQKVFVQV